MADGALFVGWNRSATGREQQAMNLFMQVMEYYGELQKSGRIESFEPVILAAHGGDMNGFVLLRGDAATLDEIRREDTFLSHVIEANYCLEGFGVIPGYLEDGINTVFSKWASHFS